MKSPVIIACLTVAIVSSGMPSACHGDEPASAEQFRKTVELAAKTKNTGAVRALLDWEGVSADMRKEMLKETSNIFIQPVSAVKLLPLPPNAQLTNEVNGTRYKPNLTVLGLLDIEYTKPGNSIQLPYGVKNGGFYIPCMLEEKIAPPAAALKSLSLSIIGTTAGVEFSGSYVYLKNGKEIKGDIKGNGNWSEAFWGNTIKTCSVHSTSPAGDIKLTIMQNGRCIFESPSAGSVAYLPQ